MDIIILVLTAWMVWDSTVMISEKKARYKAGTHDYYDNPIEDWRDIND